MNYTTSYANNVEHYRVCKEKRGSVTIDKETHYKDLVTLIKVKITSAG